MSSGDVWSGGVLAALGSYVVVESAQWEYLGADGPGPGFFPMWYGIAIVVLSLVLVAGALKRRRRAPGPTPWREIGRALGVWSAFAVSAALLPLLGFMLSFALLTAFIMCVMYGRPLRSGLAAGALGAAAFYLVFPFALEVTLPVGILGF
jgi:putative tricarboxylic transport membrane protein